MKPEPGGIQGRAAIVGEGPAHGTAVAPHNFRLEIRSAFELPFDGAHPADAFFQFLLGMPVCFLDGLGGFAQIMEVTQLMRHMGQDLFHSTADGVLAIGNHPDDGYFKGLLD
jgi:hypothetical protein